MEDRCDVDDMSKEHEDKDKDVKDTAGAEDELGTGADAGQDVTDSSVTESRDDKTAAVAKDNGDRSWLAPGSARFILLFILFVVTVFLVYNHFKESSAMAKYMSTLAKQVGAVLRLGGRRVRVRPAMAIVIYRGFWMQVIPDCGAVPSMSIFTAAILAFPARIRHKVIGILFGLPLLYVVNVGRLVCLAVIGATCPLPVFRFAHVYVWQTIFIVFVVLIWFLWITIVTSEGGLRHFVRHMWSDSRLAFALRFVCFGIIALALFVVLLPVYAWIMVHVAGFCLDMIGGYDIRDAAVSGAYGIGSIAPTADFIHKVFELQMVVQHGDARGGMVASELGFTLAPFLALVAATGGVKWRRRLKAAGIGVGILLTWQFLMFCTFFIASVSFGATKDTSYVRVMGFVNAVLPFLIWFVMLGVRLVPGWSLNRSTEGTAARDE